MQICCISVLRDGMTPLHDQEWSSVQAERVWSDVQAKLA